MLKETKDKVVDVGPPPNGYLCAAVAGAAWSLLGGGKQAGFKHPYSIRLVLKVASMRKGIE